MVTFNERSFTITIETHGQCPVEMWLNTQNKLIDLLRDIDVGAACGERYFEVLTLLQSMAPDLNTSLKMINNPLSK